MVAFTALMNPIHRPSRVVAIFQLLALVVLTFRPVHAVYCTTAIHCNIPQRRVLRTQVIQNPTCECLLCEAGWTGTNCDIPTVCTNALDCNNRATSVTGNRPNCLCFCSPDYTGSSCETESVCTNPGDCNNHATSVSGNRPSCACTCQEGWTGASCETSNACTNLGDCSNRATSVSGNRPSCACTCVAGYVGGACSTRVCAMGADCNTTGAVSAHGAYPGCWCMCNQGFGGGDCGRVLTESSVVSVSLTVGNDSRSLSFFASRSQSASASRISSTSVTGNSTTSTSLGTNIPSLSDAQTVTRSVGSRSTSSTRSMVTENVTLTLSCPGPVRAMLLMVAEEANTTTAIDRCALKDVWVAAATLIASRGGGNNSDHATSSVNGNRSTAVSIPPCTVLYAVQSGGQVVAVPAMPATFPALFVLPYAVDVNWDIAPTTAAPSLSSATTSPLHVSYALIPDSALATNTDSVVTSDTDVIQSMGRARGALVWVVEAAPGDAGGETTFANVQCTCGAQRMHTTFAVQWPRKTINTATEVITGLVAVAGPFSSDPSSAAALAMVNLLSCTSKTSALASSGYVISVFFTFGPAAIALGNLGLICAVTLIGFVAVRCALGAVCCSQQDAPTEQGTMSLLRFPSIPLTVADFLIPGVVFGISTGLASGEAVAASIVALLGVCVVVGCGQYLLHRVVLPAAHCEPYELPYPTGHPLEQRFLFPVVRWMPRPVVQPYLPLMNNMQQRYAPMKVCDLFLSCALSVATGMGIGSNGASCSVAPVVVTVLYLLYAGVLVVLRPQRLPADRVLSPAIIATFGIICALKYVGGSRNEAISGNLQLLLGVLQMGQTACTLYLRFRERQWQRILSGGESDAPPSLGFLALDEDDATSYTLPLSEVRAAESSQVVHCASLTEVELKSNKSFSEAPPCEDVVVLESFWNADGTAKISNDNSSGMVTEQCAEGLLPLSYLVRDATRSDDDDGVEYRLSDVCNNQTQSQSNHRTSTAL